MSEVSENEKKFRCFVALHCPPELIEKIAVLQTDLSAKLPAKAFSWTRPEQFHLTLRFFGNVSQTELGQVSTILENICKRFTKFTLKTGAIGCFPRASSPRVLWLGLSDESGTLEKLYHEIKLATARIGQTPEDRPFKPHLTLARVRELGRSDVEALRIAMQEVQFETEVWPVRNVALVRSQLSPKGATYSDLGSFELRE